jgi:uncharacterized protein (DUF3084 family)
VIVSLPLGGQKMTTADEHEHDHDDESLVSGDRRENETEEEAKTRKRKERLEQNRISARESRKRKKTMIEELQRTVITLSRENKDLNERNESLRRQLMEIGGKASLPLCHHPRHQLRLLLRASSSRNGSW